MPLKELLIKKITEMQGEVKAILKEHGEKVLSQATVGQAYGGMRDIKCMVWETSLLDPMEGIRFRGYSIPEVREKSFPRQKAEKSLCLKVFSGSF